MSDKKFNGLSVYPEIMTYKQIHLNSAPTSSPSEGTVYSWTSVVSGEIVLNFKLSDGTLKSIGSGVSIDLDNYVQKIDGKSLSTNDFTTAEKNKLSGINLDNYVQKIDGKSLSTNDFTTAEKNKLSGINLDNYVQKIDGKSLSTNDFTTAEKNKLSGIAANAQVNGPIDSSIISNSSNAVAGGAVYTALENKISVTNGTATTIVKQNVNTIPSGTTSFTFELDKIYYHSPSSAPTYTLPAVSDSTMTHEILIDINMASTASLAFQTSSSVAIEVKTSLTPAVGDKWSYYCVYKFGEWKIFGIRVEEA